MESKPDRVQELFAKQMVLRYGFRLLCFPHMKNKSKGERKGWPPLSEADLKIDLTYLKGKKVELKHIAGKSFRLIIK